MMRVLAIVTTFMFLGACGSEQDSARFERVEDRADIENPNMERAEEEQTARDSGYRHEAPFHTDETERVAPPPPGAE